MQSWSSTTARALLVFCGMVEMLSPALCHGCGEQRHCRRMLLLDRHRAKKIQKDPTHGKDPSRVIQQWAQ